MELPDIGAEGKVLKKSDTFGVVESVKTASDVYAPVSGEVVEINPVLDNEPEAVRSLMAALITFAALVSATAATESKPAACCQHLCCGLCPLS